MICARCGRWVGGCTLQIVVCMVQVPLMAEVPRARAALDAHVGEAGVARAGLAFLYYLSDVAANIPVVRAAGIKELVTTTLSRHPALAEEWWAQELLKRA